jgi:hypothetical protein
VNTGRFIIAGEDQSFSLAIEGKAYMIPPRVPHTMDNAAENIWEGLI